MKTLISKNLINYFIITFLLTALFRFGLSSSIEVETLAGIIIIPTLYGALMWMTGVFFGKKDRVDLPIYDVGFRFHFATFLSHNIVSFTWFLLGFSSTKEHIAAVYITAVIWGIALLIHFIFFLKARKSTIKDLNKTDLFE